jgi:hypothetical protein
VTGSRPGRVALLLLLAVLGPGSASRASARLGIEATLDRDRVVAGGETATLTIVVRSSGLSLPEPAMPRVEGISLEPVGSAQNFSIIEGRIERSATFAYRVRGLHAGVFTVPPISIESGGERAVSSPLSITVLPPGQAPPGVSGGREPWSGSGGPPQVFARVVLDRDRVYWNEAIAARLRIYARVRLLEQPDWKPPEARGFWVEDLGTPRVERVRVDGVPYDVSEIGWALFPTRAGKLSIGPARVRCRIERVIPAPDPWSSLGLPESEAQDVTLETRPVEVTVLPLPPDAPEGFSGAVGSYSLTVRVDRAEVRAGEPATVTTLVRGSGNIASLRDPEVTGPATARRYVAGTSTRIDRAGTALAGERSQQVSFLPGASGTLVIDPVRFAWFDPEEGRYRSAGAETIRIRVLPPAGGARASGTAAIRPAEPLARPRTGKGPAGPLTTDPPPGAVAVGSLALLVHAGTFSLARWRARRARDPLVARRAALDALLRGTLEECRARLAAGEVQASAKLAATVLRSAVECRYGLPPSGETGRVLLGAAQAHGAPPEEAERIARLLERLQAAAFAPPRGGDAGLAAEIVHVEEIVRRHRGELR